MIKICKNLWDKNKLLLEAELRKSTKLNSCDYEALVIAVVLCILNSGDEDGTYDVSKITVINDGDWQGTQLFLIPERTYQPSECEYLMTYVGYGSCSGCDTLQAIQSYQDGPLTESQVKDFMALCLHLTQNIIKPYNCGWRESEDFMPCKDEEPPE